MTCKKCEAHQSRYYFICVDCWEEEWDKAFADVLEKLPEDTTMCKR